MNHYKEALEAIVRLDSLDNRTTAIAQQALSTEVTEPKEVNIKDAVTKLCKELESDSSYFIAWQANIAMSFKDEFYRVYPDNELAEIHNIANNAAINFLKLLISK